VVDLQNQLRATGFFNGSPTGFYGSETEAAVANFQQSNNLTADGVAGPATLAALQNTTPTQDSTSDTGILSRGCNSSTVADLQNNLAAAGYYKGPIDGAYGAMTEAAVMKFQEATNLTTDGVAGPATLSALQNGITSGQNSNSSEQNSNSTNNILSSGSEGTEVAALQVGLAAAGYYNGSVDGIYGTGTETSVANFQTDNDLEPDGVAGPDTLLALTGETQLVSNLSNRKLETIPFKPPTVGLASEAEENKGQYIVALHALLKVNLPNLPNEPEISEEVYKEFQKDVELAEFESATKEIITKFQEQQGLNADGIVGVRTWAALLSRENEATPPESVPPSLVSITSPEGFTSTLVVLTD
jgi:peptidoglycan hydrolase-like protein with peptidoglycan-binding domain